MNKHLLFAFAIILFSFSAKSQTNVSGNITQNTTWTKANSPYVLVGNVGVPAAYTLTIEPGVVVQRNSGYFQFIINGALKSAGTMQDSIAFISPDTAEYPVTYLVFKKSNLTNSTLRFVKFPSIAFFNILVGDEVFSGQETNPKNSGILRISRSGFRGDITTGGISTTASVIVDSCSFIASGVSNNSSSSEHITLSNSKLDSAVVAVATFSGGISISNCQFSHSRFSYGGGYATSFSIDSSNFENCEFSDYSSSNVPVIISHSTFLNTAIRFFSSSLSITDSKLVATDKLYTSQNITTDSNFIFASAVSMKNCEMTNLSPYNISGMFLINGGQEVGDTIVHNRFTNLYTGITVFRFTSIQLDSNDFYNRGVYDIVNNDSKDFSALYNYFQLNNGQTIDDVIYDQNDNLNYGLVIFTPYAGSPNTGVLPITLTSFTGTKEGTTIKLSWQTSNEVNVSKFIIQKKIGNGYTDIGTVISSNTTNGVAYFFTDASPVSGNNYYRLKIVDKDGKYAYSAVVPVAYDNLLKTWRVYPNPASIYIVVEYSAANDGTQLQLINTAGSVVKTLPVTKGSTQTKMTINGVAKGTYKIVLKDGTQTESKTLLIQ